MLLSGSPRFSGLFGRPHQRSRLQVFGDELGMLTQPIALTFDLHGDGVVQQAIQQRAGDHDIAEDLAPFAEAAVTGQDQRSAFAAGVDQLQEQVDTSGGDGQIADLIDDEQGVTGEEANALNQLAFPFSGAAPA
jgi:hypothetical protein